MAKEPTTLKPAEIESLELAGGLLPNSDLGVKSVADLAQKAQLKQLFLLDTNGLGVGLPKEVPLLLNHANGEIRGFKAAIDTYRLLPERRTGTAKVTTLASFIDLTNRHKDVASVIFAQTAIGAGPKLTAVIDYHQFDGAARWCGYRVEYTFPLTEEFKAWVAMNGKAMEQSVFAHFLEDHAAEIGTPYDGERTEYERLFKEKFATPAELIALSRDLEIYVGAKVKRAERLSSGERTVEFVEEHSNGKGEKVEIPGIFMVAVPAFLDGEPVRVPARLRYRVAGGAIHWFYQLYRLDEFVRDRVKDDMLKAADKCGLPAFEGAPE